MHVFASQTMFADDTPITALDRGLRPHQTGGLWIYARDDRRWNRTDPAGSGRSPQSRSQGCDEPRDARRTLRRAKEFL
jgi:hypothetical protein